MQTNQGDVELPNGAGTLRCTLAAFKQVNAHFGNFLAANTRIDTADAAACAAVVAAGLGLKSAAEGESVLFTAGMLDSIKSLREYLSLLANGGRPYVAPAEDAKTDEPGND